MLINYLIVQRMKNILLQGVIILYEKHLIFDIISNRMVPTSFYIDIGKRLRLLVRVNNFFQD